MSENVLPTFSSRTFIVSDLTFKSLIHFEFIFVYGVRKCSSFILLQVVDQFSQHPGLILCCLMRLSSLDNRENEAWRSEWFVQSLIHNWLLPWLSGKEFTCDAGDTSSIPGSGRSPRKGNGNPLQDSCLWNPMDRGTRQIVVHGVTKELDTTYWLNNNTVYIIGNSVKLWVWDPESSVHFTCRKGVWNEILIPFFIRPLFESRLA